MKTEEIAQHLTEILDWIEKTRGEISQEHERFRITLSSSLRLLTEGDQSMLIRLHGSPEALVGYLLKLAQEFHNNSHDRNEKLRNQIMDILEAIRKS